MEPARLAAALVLEPSEPDRPQASALQVRLLEALALLVRLLEASARGHFPSVPSALDPFPPGRPEPYPSAEPFPPKALGQPVSLEWQFPRVWYSSPRALPESSPTSWRSPD